jgi:ABC-type polysaccharide/polyol phosphate export permease
MLFGIIVLPASVIYNIKKVILNYKQKSPRRIFGLIWTVLSPILHLVIFGLAGVWFVAATGGV